MNKEIATIDLETALARIKDLESKNVVAIGTDNAFALTDKDGQIKAFKTVLNLSVEDGTLVQIGNYPAAPVTISAQGYEAWAEKTGASVIFPKDVLVGSQLMPNPYMERDQDNKRVLAVHARAVAFKYSPMGLPQVCDWTTIFDVPSYRMIDLLAKAKKTPQAFKLLPSGMEPPVTKNGNETWANYPFDEATNLWLNTSHPEVLDWFSSIINREKKSMDFAQTFARRNALKHLSGLQKPPQKAHNWSLPVLAWRPTGDNIVKWDAAQYSELQDRVSGMIEGKSEFGHGETKQLEVKKGVEKISEELDNTEITDDVNPDDPIEVESITESEQSKPEPKKEISRAMANIITMREEFPEYYADACDSLGLSRNFEVFTDDECVQISKAINSLVDGDNA